jgi:formate-dependent nitrite reductase membrane component NrfD
MVHGEIWTIKEMFVYPNEYIYWSIQIVMYPFMTGLVAGAFVLSSLYHVFGIRQLKDMARFALSFHSPCFSLRRCLSSSTFSFRSGASMYS